MPLTPIQKRNVVRISIGSLAIAIGLCGVSLLSVGGIPWRAQAAEETCCKAGDETPPLELVKQVPKGELHSPYPDYAKMAKDDPDLVKQFRLPDCNECHGGGGRRRHLPGLEPRRLVLGQYGRRAVQACDAGLRGSGKTGLQALELRDRARTDAADGCHHQERGPALEDHRLHPVDQSSRRQSSGESAPLRMTAAAPHERIGLTGVSTHSVIPAKAGIQSGLLRVVSPGSRLSPG